MKYNLKNQETFKNQLEMIKMFDELKEISYNISELVVSIGTIKILIKEVNQRKEELCCLNQIYHYDIQLEQLHALLTQFNRMYESQRAKRLSNKSYKFSNVKTSDCVWHWLYIRE